jgi:Uma2 family endonuclease
MAIGEALMTAEEFGRMPDDGRCTELVRGRIVEVPRSTFLHGWMCANVAYLVGLYVERRKLGRMCSNDSGVVTLRDPDTVRGADLAFYSFERLSRDPDPEFYPVVAPDLIFEIRSPLYRWGEILTKASEYIQAGVLVVCVLDTDTRNAHLYYPDQAPRIVGPDDELTIPECLGDLRVAVRRFFE